MKLSSIPFLTITLMSLSCIYFITVQKPPSNHLLEWILSPVIHANIEHLYWNLMGFAIVGSLVELWVASSLRERLSIFVIGYGINEAMALGRFIYFGEPSIGLSLLIFMFTGFAIYHYSLARPLSGLRKVIPIAIGFVFCFLLLQFADYIASLGFVQAVNTEWQHFFAFIFGLLAIRIYQSKKEETQASDAAHN